jgi:hypothetical protein
MEPEQLSQAGTLTDLQRSTWSLPSP